MNSDEGERNEKESPTNSLQIISDDDEIDYSIKPEFYDPDLDDKDELWIQKKRKGHVSDAVLSCPACFTTLCLDCQRHEKYVTQYRAIFVVNCKIKSDQVLEAGSKRKRGKKGRVSGEKTEGGSGGGGETYRSVCCVVCSTQVGVIDEDQVYHFFNVLPNRHELSPEQASRILRAFKSPLRSARDLLTPPRIHRWLSSEMKEGSTREMRDSPDEVRRRLASAKKIPRQRDTFNLRLQLPAKRSRVVNVDSTSAVSERVTSPSPASERLPPTSPSGEEALPVASSLATLPSSTSEGLLPSIPALSFQSFGDFVGDPDLASYFVREGASPVVAKHLWMACVSFATTMKEKKEDEAGVRKKLDCLTSALSDREGRIQAMDRDLSAARADLELERSRTDDARRQLAEARRREDALRVDLAEAGSKAIASWKSSEDYESIRWRCYLDGYEDLLGQISASDPHFDATPFLAHLTSPPASSEVGATSLATTSHDATGGGAPDSIEPQPPS